MSLIPISDDRGDTAGFFGRRQTAALALLASSSSTQLLSLTTHVINNIVVIWLLAHTVLILSTLWILAEILIRLTLHSLDQRYKQNLCTQRRSSRPVKRPAKPGRVQREHGDAGDSLSEYGSRSVCGQRNP